MDWRELAGGAGVMGHAARACAGLYEAMNPRTFWSVSGQTLRPLRKSRTKCGSFMASRPNVTGDIDVRFKKASTARTKGCSVFMVLQCT